MKVLELLVDYYILIHAGSSLGASIIRASHDHAPPNTNCIARH